jgi:hypothetical protein
MGAECRVVASIGTDYIRVRLHEERVMRTTGQKWRVCGFYVSIVGYCSVLLVFAGWSGMVWMETVRLYSSRECIVRSSADA